MRGGKAMKIGLIVYSQGGHTLSVALKLKEKLSADGHGVTLEQIETTGPVRPGDRHAELKTTPAIDAYDAVVLGAPVWGGSPAAPMLNYLEQAPSLAGKKVACLVTGFFPAGWGRNQAINKMKAICEVQGATVCGSGSVGWFSLRRRQQIATAVESLRALF
jgi:flavodoxin